MEGITELERTRARLGLTQEAVAKAAGVSRHTIVRAEKGQFPARYVTRLRIAEVLGTTPEELFSDDRTAA